MADVVKGLRKFPLEVESFLFEFNCCFRIAWHVRYTVSDIHIHGNDRDGAPVAPLVIVAGVINIDGHEFKRSGDDVMSFNGSQVKEGKHDARLEPLDLRDLPATIWTLSSSSDVSSSSPCFQRPFSTRCEETAKAETTRSMTAWRNKEGVGRKVVAMGFGFEGSSLTVDVAEGDVTASPAPEEFVRRRCAGVEAGVG